MNICNNPNLSPFLGQEMPLTKEEIRGPDMQEKNAHKYISKYFIPLTLVDDS